MRTTIRIARWLGFAGMLLLLPAGARAVTQPAVSAPPAASHGDLSLQKGSGKVVSLNVPAANVFVADPKVVEVRPASATTLFVFGIGAGRTTVAAMDNAGHLVAQYEVTVQPSGFSAAQAQSAIARLVPGSQVKVQAQQKGILLTGSVNSPEDAAQAVAIAKGYVTTDASNVDNELVIRSPIQVTLMVRMAEISRGVVQNLGINWQALGSIGSWNFGFFTPANLAAGNGAGALLANVLTKGGPDNLSANAVIDALAGDNLAHILAEPNLTVLSGQTASFQAGGEFPIPIGEANGAISIEFKSFGVMLKFTPTVMSDGRINLHVSPEVQRARQGGWRAACRGQCIHRGARPDRAPRGDHRPARQRAEFRHCRTAAADHQRQQPGATRAGQCAGAGRAVPLECIPASGIRIGDHGDAVHRPASERYVEAASAHGRLLAGE